MLKAVTNDRLQCVQLLFDVMCVEAGIPRVAVGPPCSSRRLVPVPPPHHHYPHTHRTPSELIAVGYSWLKALLWQAVFAALPPCCRALSRHACRPAVVGAVASVALRGFKRGAACKTRSHAEHCGGLPALLVFGRGPIPELAIACRTQTGRELFLTLLERLATRAITPIMLVTAGCETVLVACLLKGQLGRAAAVR